MIFSSPVFFILCLFLLITSKDADVSHLGWRRTYLKMLNAQPFAEHSPSWGRWRGLPLIISAGGEWRDKDAYVFYLDSSQFSHIKGNVFVSQMSKAKFTLALPWRENALSKERKRTFILKAVLFTHDNERWTLNLIISDLHYSSKIWLTWKVLLL